MENFKANRKSFNRQGHERTLKPEEILCLSKVTSFNVITMNLVFNFICRKKKHSLFH